MKTIKGDLILTEDTKFEEDIKVEGNIVCKGGSWNIDAWNIDAQNIDARNIDALNIVARNIDARDIDALDIDALDIDAWNITSQNIIYCEKIIKKSKNSKVKAKVLIEGRSKLEQKEW